MSKVTLLTTTFILSCVSIALVQAEVTVIEGGTLINGTGSEPVRDAVVIIDGNQIRATGRRGQVSYPAGAQVIDAAGKFIVPGLIESHIHYRHWLPEILLSYGTTSIFDICNETEWILAQKEGIAKGKIFGPRIFAVGPLLNGPPNMQIYSRFQIDEIILESREHARQVVRELVAKGVDAIKVYANTTVELLKAVADEAHKAGLPVLGHLKINARDAARAGIDNLVHGGGLAIATLEDPEKIRKFKSEYIPKLPSGEDPEYVWLSYPASDPWYLLDPADFDDLVQFLVQEQVVINPTSTSVWKGAHNRRRAHTQEIIEVFSNPALAYVPRRMIAHWLDYSGYDQLSSEESAKVKEGYRKFNLFLKKFVEAGGKVLPGSDPVHSGVPGVGLHHELELLVDAGISPMRAIQAATKDSADFMRKGDQLGTIEPGKLADLIIVREDPLANISNLRKIDLVMKDGEVVDTTYHSHYTNPLPRDESQQTFDKQLITIEIAPKAVAEGSQALTLTVRGKYFRRNATVHFDGVGLVTQFVNATELKATVPRALVTKVGVYPIIVTGAGGPSAVRSKPAHLIVKFK